MSSGIFSIFFGMMFMYEAAQYGIIPIYFSCPKDSQRSLWPHSRSSAHVSTISNSSVYFYEELIVRQVTGACDNFYYYHVDEN